jgi:hypothetical protein
MRKSARVKISGISASSSGVRSDVVRLSSDQPTIYYQNCCPVRKRCFARKETAA